MDASNDKRRQALNAIYFAMDQINTERSPDKLLEKEETTHLFGIGANMDSLELVTLILAVESKVSNQLGVAVTLADEKAMSQRNSPFLTVKTLADYIVAKIEESSRD